MCVVVVVCVCLCFKPHLNEKLTLHGKVTQLTFLFMGKAPQEVKQKHCRMPVPQLSDRVGSSSIFSLPCFLSFGYEPPFPQLDLGYILGGRDQTFLGSPVLFLCWLTRTSNMLVEVIKQLLLHCLLHARFYPKPFLLLTIIL